MGDLGIEFISVLGLPPVDFVHLAADLPSTTTHKVLKRQLIAQETAIGEDETLWEREPRGTAYQPASRTDA
jgi:fatty-acyl-CoA synthase